MLATINFVVLLVWLIAELIPAAADRLAALESELKRRDDRES